MERQSHVFSRSHRRRAVTLSALAIGALALSACGQEPEVPTLRLADSYSTAHPFAEHGVSVFIEELEKAGFEVDYFPAGQMGNAKDLANMVKSDVIDIGPAAASYLEDDMPLSSVSDLPNRTGDSCVAASAMMDLLGEGGILFDEEYAPQGMRPLWMILLPTYELMTADRRIAHPDDVSGLLIRSSGGAFDVTLDAIGASAVSMPGGDTYEAMTRGTVDGAAFPWVSAATYNLGDVSQYSTEGLNLGSVSIPYVISEETWDALTPEQQAAVNEAGEIANQSLCEGINAETEAARTTMAENRLQYVPIEGENAQAWGEDLADVRQTWATSLDEIGLPASEVLNSYEEAVTRYEQ